MNVGYHETMNRVAFFKSRAKLGGLYEQVI